MSSPSASGDFQERLQSVGVVLETTTSLKFEARDRHNVYLVAISVLEMSNEMLLSS